MKIIIRTIGKESSKEIKNLINEYLKRFNWKIDIEEIQTEPSKEGEMLLKNMQTNSFVIALDETGELMDSKKFATNLEKTSQHYKCIYFLIGGAHGHTDLVRKKADLLLSLGKLTFPHMLVRLILIEQLYRAHTIMNNHPYHK